ncbi:hypothetical protein QQ054_05030 [Oscillatoria amoena NRMC-F 0135]|nr:hypothetical protein [Oscillatoria amoena NRMC-F 0135]
MVKHAFLSLLICLVTAWTAVAQDNDPDVLKFDALQGVEMMDKIGASAVVEGTVQQVTQGKTGKATFINFASYSKDSKDFHLVVFDKTTKGNPHGWSEFLKNLSGKTIRVSGTLEEFKGRPQIVIQSMEQIEVVE